MERDLKEDKKIMFDFFKKDTDEDLIKEVCKMKGKEGLLDDPEFETYMKLMMKGYDNPEDITQVCIMVIVALAHYHEMPKHLFMDLLNTMEQTFDNLPSKELMQSMIEFNLV